TTPCSGRASRAADAERSEAALHGRAVISQQRRRTEMRIVVMIFYATLLPSSCFGAEVARLYYVGESKICHPSCKPHTSYVILLEKPLDPDNSVFAERAIQVKPDGKAEEFIMNHRVKGNTFPLDDDKGMVTGSGTLFGPEWKWTYFKATYQATNGARIDD